MQDVLPPQEALGRHFTLAEFCQSEAADRLGRDVEVRRGSPTVQALRLLVVSCLDPLRQALGVPLFVSSGYRPDWLNREVGGAETSQHVLGEAADLYCRQRYTPYDVARQVVRMSLPYDQVLLEHDQGVVHVSHTRGRNRREALTRVQGSDGVRHYLYGVLTEEQAWHTLANS